MGIQAEIHHEHIIVLRRVRRVHQGNKGGDSHGLYLRRDHRL